MQLLLDECAGDRYLRDALTAAGHDVVRSVDALGGGVADSAVFAYACSTARIIVTYNNADFVRLAQQERIHPGILLIYQDNKPTDMAAADIIDAIAHVTAVTPAGIAGTVVVLNKYRW